MMVWVAIWRLPEIRSIQTQLNPFPRQWTSPRSGLPNRQTLDDRKFLILLVSGWPREGTAASVFLFSHPACPMFHCHSPFTVRSELQSFTHSAVQGERYTFHTKPLTYSLPDPGRVRHLVCPKHDRCSAPVREGWR